MAVVTRRPRADDRTVEPRASPDATDQDTRYRYRYYLSPTCVSEVELEEPSLAELARVIYAGLIVPVNVCHQESYAETYSRFIRGQMQRGIQCKKTRCPSGTGRPSTHNDLAKERGQMDLASLTMLAPDDAIAAFPARPGDFVCSAIIEMALQHTRLMQLLHSA